MLVELPMDNRGAVLPKSPDDELKKPELSMLYPVSKSEGSIIVKLEKP
ncbi:MAG: hypothetical protein BWY61_00586 [Firmicutes bacterium ADurb.Bin354]|nr:MAG: hypothetical protein BWY61_00586 [Firmicutes bacterium ADurb.Bin354]